MRPIIYRALAAVCLLTGPATAGAETLRLDTGSACQEREPDVAALPGGRFVAVWQQGEEPETLSRPRIFARLFGQGESGTLPDPEFLVNDNVDGTSPEVAANAAGNFVVVWLDGSDRVRSRAYSPAGAVLGPERSLSGAFANGVAVTATNDGGFAVVVADDDSLILSRLDSSGQPLGTFQTLSSVTYPFPITGFRDPVVAAYGPSGVVVGMAFDDNWVTEVGALAVTSAGEVQLLDLGLPGLPLQQDVLRRSRLAVAANAAGQILVAWTMPDTSLLRSVLRGRVFGADRQPLGPAFEIDNSGAAYVSPPDAVANDVDGSGDFLVAWHSLSLLPPDTSAVGAIARIHPDGRIVRPYVHAWDTIAAEGPSLALDSQGRALVAWQTGDRADGPAVETCYSSGLFARQVGVPSEVLLLRDNRFEVRARWTGHAGSSGEGRAVYLTSDSGTFWFFGEDNVELIVKVLDGRAVNGHYWVFYGSLSDVAFTIEVTDTATGQTKTYENPAGQLASRADTLAFPAVEASAAADTVSLAPRSHVPPSGGAGPCSPAAPPEAPRPGLCLGNRFEVEVAWHALGETGLGQGVRLTRDSGYLWFFDDANIELVVKVLDGRAVNGRFWVFYGALTDVEYTVLVRDTVTGQVRTYHNPAGQLRSHADTSAF
jgi:hypothetical protein